MSPEDYPNSDFPYTFYVMDKQLPKYSNCWHFIPGSNYETPIYSKIDHVGVVESSPAGEFAIAAQEILLAALKCKPDDLECDFSEKDLIRRNIIDGTLACIEIAQAHRVVFWTSGYEQDALALRNYILRSNLPNNDPMYAEPPHVRRYKRDLSIDFDHRLHALRACSGTHGVDKALKRRLQGLSALPPPDIAQERRVNHTT